jgi:predicted ATPase
VARREQLLSDALGHRDMSIFTRTWSTHLMWHDGCPDRARAHADRAIAAAGTINHPFTRTIALAYAAMLAQFRRDTVEVARLAGAAIELASMHGFPYYRAWCEILRGWSLICDARSGKREDDTVLGEMRKAVDVVRTTAGFRLPYYRGLLAEAYERLGRAREGLDEIASAMDGVRRTGECWWEPELVRIRGTLLQKADRGDVEGAACFRRAVDLARQSGARILELRALTSLVKTACRARHEREAGRRRLADAYAGFTERLDTPDLRDARAVLDAAG